MEGSLKRVLVCDRAKLAVRTVRTWQEMGLETVQVFDEADAEAAWVEEADYAVFSGAGPGESQEPARIVAAAMDSGCDVIDPGPLVDDRELLDVATRANLPIVGTDPTRPDDWSDPDALIAVAGEVGVPAAPFGPWDDPQSLRRRVDVWVLVDRMGGRTVVGAVEATVAPWQGTPWLLELGHTPGPAAKEALGEASARLADHVATPGLVRVRWGWLDETTWALRGLTGTLGSAWALSETVHELDLVKARIRAWYGGAGVSVTLQAERHGVLARVLALEDGVVAGVEVAESSTAHVEPGQSVVRGDDLGSVIATGPTRQAALVRLARDLDAVRVNGVPTNVDGLRAVVSDRAFWDGRLDARGAAALLGGARLAGEG